MDNIFKSNDYAEVWKWLDRRTHEFTELDDYVLALHDSPKELKVVLDFLNILFENKVIN